MCVGRRVIQVRIPLEIHPPTRSLRRRTPESRQGRLDIKAAIQLEPDASCTARVIVGNGCAGGQRADLWNR